MSGPVQLAELVHKLAVRKLRHLRIFRWVSCVVASVAGLCVGVEVWALVFWPLGSVGVVAAWIGLLINLFAVVVFFWMLLPAIGDLSARWVADERKALVALIAARDSGDRS